MHIPARLRVRARGGSQAAGTGRGYKLWNNCIDSLQSTMKQHCSMSYMGLRDISNLLQAVSTYMQPCTGLHGTTDAQAACVMFLVQLEACLFMAGVAQHSNTTS